jgi:hypothetical protein
MENKTGNENKKKKNQNRAAQKKVCFLCKITSSSLEELPYAD